MDPAEVIDIIREGIFVLLKISAPVMLAALIIGLMISLFQALTQIQEATLTFVPKIIAMMLVLSMALPFMQQELQEFSQKLSERIVNIE